MIDLVCLLADKCIEAAIVEVLRRPEALGIRAIQFEAIVHPRRDPGCFLEAGDLLAGYTARAEHALVVLDLDWTAPTKIGADLERQLEESLQKVGSAGWARAVVIDPELEAWVFSDSPHVATALGWPESVGTLRAALEAQGLWKGGQSKPHDPKAAVDWALRRARVPRSSSMYRELAKRVSLRNCEDRSFKRLTDLLRGWFGAAHPGT